MSVEQQTPIDTSKDSVDSRIGPDGKITPEQSRYLTIKAITNIARSLSKRAEALSDEVTVDGSSFRKQEVSVHTDNWYFGGVAEFLYHGKDEGTPPSKWSKPLDDFRVAKKSRTFITDKGNFKGEHSITIRDIESNDSAVRLDKSIQISGGDILDHHVIVDPSEDSIRVWKSERNGRRPTESDATSISLEVLKEHRRVISAAEHATDNTN